MSSTDQMNQMSNVVNVADVMAAPDHYHVIITLPINGNPHYSAILDPDGDTLKPMQAVVGGSIQYVPPLIQTAFLYWRIGLQLCTQQNLRLRLTFQQKVYRPYEVLSIPPRSSHIYRSLGPLNKLHLTHPVSLRSEP